MNFFFKQKTQDKKSKLQTGVTMKICAAIGRKLQVLIDSLLSVKAATLIFISGHGLASSSAKEGKSGFIYNSLKS